MLLFLDVDTFGPVEYTNVNYILMGISAGLIFVGLIGIVYLIIRDCNKKKPVYKPYTSSFHKPPKKQYSFVYEKYFLWFNNNTVSSLENLKLPPIAETLSNTKNKMDKLNSPSRM